MIFHALLKELPTRPALLEYFLSIHLARRFAKHLFVKRSKQSESHRLRLLSLFRTTIKSSANVSYRFAQEFRVIGGYEKSLECLLDQSVTESEDFVVGGPASELKPSF